MEKTTLSSKYQVVIPLEIRKQMNATPSQQFWVMYDNGIIKLIPKVKLHELFCTLKGMHTSFERDKEVRI